VAFAEHNNVVKAFPADRTDQPFSIPILPRGARRRRSIADAYRSESADKNLTIGAVPVTNEIAGSPFRQEHRPIRYQLPARLSFRQGQPFAPNWFGTAVPLVRKRPATFELNGFLFNLPERTAVCSVVICSRALHVWLSGILPLVISTFLGAAAVA
jgi:hypothetical protein